MHKPTTMPDQKMTYAERVQKTKHQIVKTYNENQFKWDAISIADVREVAIQQVAAQAEAIREALTYSFSSFIYALQPVSADDMKQRIDLYLQEHGYIEPKTEEDGKK